MTASAPDAVATSEDLQLAPGVRRRVSLRLRTDFPVGAKRRATKNRVDPWTWGPRFRGKLMLRPLGTETSTGDVFVDAIYDKLRRLARHQMDRESGPHTLQATALVHEAWLRLEGGDQWRGSAHFYNAAARAMRRILVDRARRRQSLRGGGAERLVPIEFAEHVSEEEVDVLALDSAMVALERIDPDAHQVVQLRFFTGLSVEETSHVTGRSARSVKRDWSAARLWLFDRLRRGDREA